MIKCQNFKHHKSIFINPHKGYNEPFYQFLTPVPWFDNGFYDHLKLNIIFSYEQQTNQSDLNEALSMVDKDSIIILSGEGWLDQQFPEKVLCLTKKMTNDQRVLPPVIHWPRVSKTYAKHFKNNNTNSHINSFYCPINQGTRYKIMFLEELYHLNLLNKNNYTFRKQLINTIVPQNFSQFENYQNEKPLYLYCEERYHADILLCVETFYDEITEKTFQNLCHSQPIIWNCFPPHDYLNVFGFDLQFDGIDSIDKNKIIELPGSNEDCYRQWVQLIAKIVEQTNKNSLDIWHMNRERCLHNQQIALDDSNLHKKFAQIIEDRWDIIN